MPRWQWFLSELSNRLWLRASLYGIVAVITALISIYTRRFIPEDIPQTIGANAVDVLLHVLASSMLAVTIFSVSTMVSAYNAATINVTPRATQLLLEDGFSQNALSTFIGSFIFSVVGIIALQTGVYGNSGRLVLFVVTIAVIILIVVTLLQWVEYLSRLGRVSETIERVEEAASASLRERLDNPYLGGTSLQAGNIPDGISVFAPDVGYVRHIDMEHLSKVAEHNKATIYLYAIPGELVNPSMPLAIVGGINDEKILKEIHKAFITGRERSFRQDPRYGMAVLSEIAVRALSPAINDPGTAILVLSVGLRTLSIWAEPREDKEIKYPRVYVSKLSVEDMLEDFFAPISQHGASIIGVAIALQKTLVVLEKTGHSDLARAANDQATKTLKRSHDALLFQTDRENLNDTVAILRRQ